VSRVEPAGHVIELRPGTRLIRDLAYRAAFTVRIDGTDQSYVDLDDPRRLEFDYVQRIADVIDVLAEPNRPLRIAHVGGGALTVPRYVATSRPRSAQLVFEPDADLTAFVRKHLPLPQRSGIRVRAQDGQSGVRELPAGTCELIIVDAFVGAQVPAELTTMEFLTDVRRALVPSGTVVINFTDRGPSTYGRRVLAGLGSVFAHTVLSAEPSTLKGRRFGNVLVLGSDAPLPVTAFAERASRGPYPYRVLHGGRLAQLASGHTGFTLADAQRSALPDPRLSWPSS
jgi:spermidine synthase